MNRLTLMALSSLLFSNLSLADSTPHVLSSGSLTQNWTSGPFSAIFNSDDNWSGVPSIEGLRGDGLAGGAANPETILAADDVGVPDVNINQSNPNTFSTGGVTEFSGIADQVVALAGSNTADAPYLRISLNTTGRESIQVAYNLRDIDGSADNSIQPVALHYRVGNTGIWTNVASAFVADASSGPNLATLVTPVAVTLPAATENQALVQVRVMTNNAAGNDEWIGVDDIVVSSAPAGTSVVASAVVDSNVTTTGGSDGQATASASAGTAPYTYLWNNSANTASITGLTAGVYTVTVSDAALTFDIASVTITEPTAILVTATATDASAFGFFDGTATATPTTGTAPYTYLWSNSGTTATIAGLGAGTYTVTVTDNNFATGTASAVVSQPTALVASAVVDSNATTTGGSDGQATASASGGTAPYSYLWSNGANIAINTGLIAGVYTVTVTDANLADDTASVTITEPAAISVTATATDATAFGFADGTATANPTTGTAPYSYLWSNGGNTQNITGLMAGTYVVTVTDANSGQGIASAVVSQPTAVVATAVVDSNVTTNGGSDGQATASATGGVAPYTYFWSNASTTATNTGLAAGVYTATVTDANGAFDTASATITEPASISVTATSTDVTVNGASDGTATATPTTGTAPYSYLWSNSGTTATITGLVAGTYTVTVTDANSATGTASAVVSQPTAVVAYAVVDSNVTTTGGSDGQATASGSGGNPGYTYLWSNGVITTVNSGLVAGVYNVTVTDTTGGNDVASVTITEPATISVTATATDATVNGALDGTATATANNGIAPYSYAWSNGETTPNITGLAAGTYTVTVTDANNGQGIASAVVSEPTAVVATAVVDNDVTTNGGSDGQATASAAGGVTPYAFLWSNGANTATVAGLVAGSYTVTVTDNNSASDTATITITEPATVIATAVVDNNVTTNGGSDGQATASATGGAAPYTYVWSNGALTATASGLAAGSYTVTVTDSNASTGTASVVITEPTAVLASITTTSNESSPGAADGSASVSATGGVPPYTYLWSNGANTATITGLSAGSYQVTVSDANGSAASTSVTLVVAGTPSVQMVPTNSWWMLMILAALMVWVIVRQQRNN